MKRQGNLFEKIIDPENIRAAILTVNSTHHHNKVMEWVAGTIDARIIDLQRIVSDQFTPKKPRHFVLFDQSAGKERDIYEPALWPDQYVHHMIIQALQPVFMRGMDAWCCGSIRGRGIARGMKGVKRWMREDKRGTKYAAELDIHHFYQSLTAEVVMDRMRQLIKDRRVLALLERLLNYGVLIGSYCSQWFANATLQPLDHLIREKTGTKHYMRYMDNITLFDSNKRRLHKTVHMIADWCEAHGLRLKSNWQIYPTRARMPAALGYRFGRGFTLVRKRNTLRFKRACTRAIKRIREGKRISFHVAAALLSRAGAFRHCNGHRIVKKYLDPIGVHELKIIIREEMRKWKNWTNFTLPAQSFGTGSPTNTCA